jgi:hypothetical protein
MKSKNLILFLALGSMLLVLADATSHFSQAWMDGKLLTIMKPDDQRFERINDDSHQNYGLVIDDIIVIGAQGIIIFLTFRKKPNTALDSK